MINSVTKVRVISALVAATSLFTIIKYSGYVGIAITSFFVSWMALVEYGRMTMSGARFKVARQYFVILGLVAFAMGIFRNDWILDSIVISTLLLFVLFLLIAKDESIGLEDLVNKAGLCVMGILYAGVCPVYISLLARLSIHAEWFFYTFFVVFTGDTVAYFVGTKWGRTRLFTRISPGKSVEGAIGSLFGSVLVGLVVRQIALPNTDLFLMLMLSILTSVVAQLGDLCESLIKRSFHTKDSGTIMPGHGGLLDRLDGILFAAPIVFIFTKYVILS